MRQVLWILICYMIERWQGGGSGSAMGEWCRVWFKNIGFCLDNLGDLIAVYFVKLRKWQVIELDLVRMSALC